MRTETAHVELALSVPSLKASKRESPPDGYTKADDGIIEHPAEKPS